jgi:hypothetical protein
MEHEIEEESILHKALMSLDTRTFPMGDRGVLTIQPVTKESRTDPSRWLILPRGMEGLVEPVLGWVKYLSPRNSVTVDALPLSEGMQAQYLLHSNIILDTVDYLEMLVNAAFRFDALDSGRFTQEELVVQVRAAIETR